MKKELKSGILSADCRPTVGGANVIAVQKGMLQHIIVSEIIEKGKFGVEMMKCATCMDNI